MGWEEGAWRERGVQWYGNGGTWNGKYGFARTAFRHRHGQDIQGSSGTGDPIRSKCRHGVVAFEGNPGLPLWPLRYQIHEAHGKLGM